MGALTHKFPVLVKKPKPTAEPRLRLRHYAPSAGNTAQGFCIDNIGGWVYATHGANDDVDVVITRFRRDGPRNQSYVDAQSPTALLGHQGVAVEPGTTKLWHSNGKAKQCARFDYGVNAALTNLEIYTIFSAADGVLTNANTNPAISDDGVYIAFRGSKSSFQSIIRIFLLADLKNGGPGIDYSVGYHVAQFTTESGFLSDNYPCQGHALVNGLVHVVAGSGSATRFSKLHVYSYDGYLIRADDRVDYGKEFEVADAAGGTPLREIEAISSYLDTASGKYYPMVYMCTGQSGERIKRGYIVGRSGDDFSAQQMVDKYNAVLTVPLTDNRAALFKHLWEMYDKYDVRQRHGLIYPLANESSEASLRNIYDPAFFGLTVAGTPTFTADRGWTGNGTNGALNNGRSWYATPGLDDLLAHVSIWVRSSAPTGGHVIGTNSSANTSLYPRNASDQILGRLLDQTAGSIPLQLYGVNAVVTDAKGLWVMNRQGDDKFSVWHDNVLVAENAVAAATLASTLTILRTTSSFCTAQVSFATVGSQFDTLEQMANKRAIELEYLREIGAF